MNYYFNQNKAKRELETYFRKNKVNLSSFGTRVNQTFEAYVFAKVIEHYKKRKWNVRIINPKGSNRLRLKFSTRGEPQNFSYCLAEKDGKEIQIRHQLRVDIQKRYKKQKKAANICCDIVIMHNANLDGFRTYHSLPNGKLISFGEVKHMSAFAELIAGFIGLVHELQPKRLKRTSDERKSRRHLAPFLYVSGILLNTASGIEESIKIRKFDIEIYDYNNPF